MEHFIDIWPRADGIKVDLCNRLSQPASVSHQASWMRQNILVFDVVQQRTRVETRTTQSNALPVNKAAGGNLFSLRANGIERYQNVLTHECPIKLTPITSCISFGKSLSQIADIKKMAREKLKQRQPEWYEAFGLSLYEHFDAMPFVDANGVLFRLTSKEYFKGCFEVYIVNDYGERIVNGRLFAWIYDRFHRFINIVPNFETNRNEDGSITIFTTR